MYIIKSSIFFIYIAQTVPTKGSSGQRLKPRERDCTVGFEGGHKYCKVL